MCGGSWDVAVHDTSSSTHAAHTHTKGATHEHVKNFAYSVILAAPAGSDSNEVTSHCEMIDNVINVHRP